MDTRELNDIMSQVTTNHHYLLAQVIMGVTYLWWFFFYGFHRAISAECRPLPRMLTGVQKAGRTETSASLLSLFYENPDKFFQNL